MENVAVLEEIETRQATPADVDFIVKMIIEAEASGTDTVSYQRIFDLSYEELTAMLREIVSLPDKGHELTYSSFLIAEADGIPIGGCAAWVEAQDGYSSNMAKAELLSHFLGRDRWLAAADKMELVAKVHIERAPESLQLESFYVEPNFRGQGVIQQLIEAQLKRFDHLRYTLSKAQITIINSNERSLRAYQKSGFEFVRETCTDDPAIFDLLPNNGKKLLEKEF